MTEQSLSETVRAELATVKNIETLKDPKTKKEFLNNIEKNTKASRSSIEAIYSKQIKGTARDRGVDPSLLSRTQTKKYSSDLGLNVNNKKKDENTQDGQKQELKTVGGNLKTQNPKIQVNGQPQIDIPYKHIAGSIDSIITAFIDNMDEMSPAEKEDAGACYGMLFGTYFDTHERVRALLAFIALSGLYAGRFKKARKITKAEKIKEKEQAVQKISSVTPEDKKAHSDAVQKYLDKSNVLKDDG